VAQTLSWEKDVVTQPRRKPAPASKNARQPGSTNEHFRTCLTGDWEVVRFVDYLDDGRVEYPLGEHPVGILSLDASGRMSVQVMRTPHATFASGDDFIGTPDEYIAAYRGYTAYFGTWQPDAANGAMLIHVEGALNPELVGASYSRAVTVQGEELHATPEPQTFNGVRRRYERVFRRMRPVA